MYYQTNNLALNAWRVFTDLGKETGNPLYARVVDPANSSNILSDLLTDAEKKRIIARAKIAADEPDWKNIVW